MTEEEIRNSSIFKAMTKISEKYDIKLVEAIRDEMVEASKAKGFLTTAEINLSLSLFIERMKQELESKQ